MKQICKECKTPIKPSDPKDAVVDKVLEKMVEVGMIEVVRCEMCGRPILFRPLDPAKAGELTLLSGLRITRDEKGATSWFHEEYADMKFTCLIDSRLVGDEYDADMDMLTSIAEDAGDFMSENDCNECRFDLENPHQPCFFKLEGDVVKVTAERQ